MRKGDGKSRKFESSSLTKLFKSIETICTTFEKCEHPCDSISKEVGAPANLINSDTCRLPSYSQVFRYLSTSTKQLEIVGIGWVSPDESLPTFSELLDGATLGRSAARTIAKVRPPEVAWQVSS